MPSIGTVLSGVQLKDLSNDQRNEVSRLVAKRGVVFRRN
jgi:hypothetical protein